MELLDSGALDALRSLRRPGRPDPVARVAKAYLRTAPAIVDAMAQAITDGDLEQARSQAHSLKSSTAQLGGLHLADALKALEYAPQSELRDDGVVLEKIRELVPPTLRAVEALVDDEAVIELAEPSAPRGAAVSPVESIAGRALVVDDDAELRALVAQTLEGIGFEVVQLGDGRECISHYERLGKFQDDIVLLDVVMPSMNGFDLCRWIRRDAGEQHIPILMMTGRDDSESIAEAYDAGATDFIAKPINFEILGHRVRYMLRSSQTALRLHENEALLVEAQRVAKLGYFVRAGDHRTGDHKAERWSPEVPRILGIEPESFANSFDDYLRWVHSEDRAEVEHHHQAFGGQAESSYHEHRIVRKDGEVRIVALNAKGFSDESAGAARFLVTLQDITEQRERETQIHQLSHFDVLTGLPNRRLLAERLRAAVLRATRSGRALALMSIELDRFDRINSTFGRNVGDDVLVVAAKRISNALRSKASGELSDPVSAVGALNEPSLARVGSNEFVVLLPQSLSTEEVVECADRVLRSVREEIDVSGKIFSLTASVGLAQLNKSLANGEALLQLAETAMHHARLVGGDRFEWHSDQFTKQVSQRLLLETRLRKAVDNNELEVHYQPRLDLRTGRVESVEALLRWDLPGFGPVSPADFIPIAEENGLILPIGLWVFRRACYDTSLWRKQGFDIGVSVNLSALQFRSGSLYEDLSEVLRESQLDPSSLELEVTETAVMEDSDASSRVMRRLANIGVGFAIDDFGTGYSSMSYLKRFPINTLKIDRCFIRELPGDSDDVGIVNAMLALGNSLNLKVVAEGVETIEQAKFLAAAGCHGAQGFLYSKPVPERDLLEYLRSQAVKSA